MYITYTKSRDEINIIYDLSKSLSVPYNSAFSIFNSKPSIHFEAIR